MEDPPIPRFPERGQVKVGKKGRGEESDGLERRKKGKGQGGKGQVEEAGAPQRKRFTTRSLQRHDCTSAHVMALLLEQALHRVQKTITRYFVQLLYQNDIFIMWKMNYFVNISRQAYSAECIKMRPSSAVDLFTYRHSQMSQSRHYHGRLQDVWQWTFANL